MKHLIILGAGGMGKEIYYTAINSIGYGTEFVVKGFLDYPNSDWDITHYPPILGIEDNYEIQPDDVFTCSIGDVQLKHRICEKMKGRGANFQTLIHKNATIKINAKIGAGTIVDSYAVISCDTVVGENCMIQQAAILGHDVVIGDYCRIDCQSFFVGAVKVGDRCTIHTSAVLNHKVVVEDDATIGACSFVVKKVKKGTTVFGNPARLLSV